MSLMHPNLDPFGDINDAIGRLIPFHLLQSTETFNIPKVDESKEKELLDKYSLLLDRYEALLESFKTDTVLFGQKKVNTILNPPERKTQPQFNHGNGRMF